MGDDANRGDADAALASAWASFREAQVKRAQLHAAAEKVRALCAPENRSNGHARTACAQ